MKIILLLLFMSFSLTQSLIQTKEYNIFKDNDLKEINILELIHEKKGTFKVELVDIYWLSRWLGIIHKSRDPFTASIL